MTRPEIEDAYFVDYLMWCSAPPEGRASDLLFWVDHHYVSQDNFWEWIVKYKASELAEGQKAGINGQT